jgi:ribonuclease VapC
MIVVDTSALVAIVFNEPERDVFRDIIRKAHKALISTVSVLETRVVVHGRRNQRGVVFVDDLLRQSMFIQVPPTAAYPFTSPN